MDVAFQEEDLDGSERIQFKQILNEKVGNREGVSSFKCWYICWYCWYLFIVFSSENLICMSKFLYIKNENSIFFSFLKEGKPARHGFR